MGIAIDHLPIAAAVIRLDGVIVAVNPVGCQLIRRPAEAIIGTSVFDHQPTQAPTWQAQLARIREHGSMTGEIDLVTPDGPRTIQFTRSLILVDGVEHIQSYSIDITSHKEAIELEERTAAKQRSESLGLVAGGIAHDFNNALVGVLAEASSIADDVSLPQDVREALRRIEASAKRMATLTRQLLAYSGRGRAATTLVHADDELADLVDALTRVVRGDVALAVTPNAGPVAVAADASHLREVVVNLVSNASDAVGPGGRVTVTTRLCARDEKGWWLLEVSDDGIGIDPAARARIFDPFFTTKVDHQGLGLSAVQGIVRRLGGQIDVESAEGRGARFSVRIPIVAGATAPIARRSVVAARSPLAGLHVLIADDEPSVRTTVRRLFERRGAIVAIASDGAEAEALLRSQQFGFVLLDVEMPGRRGYELVPIVRTHQPGTPVLLMSGFTDTRGEVEPDGFLEKPFTSRTLDAMIDQLLGPRKVSAT